MSNISKSRIRSSQIGSVGGVASLIVYAQEVDMHARGLDLPILHVAVGDLLELNARKFFESPMSVFGRIGSARELARVDARTGSARAGDELTIRLYGELTASWVNLSLTKLSDQAASLNQVIQRIRGHPPKVASYIKYAKKCYKAACAGTSGSYVPSTKVQDDLGFETTKFDRYSTQWYDFHMYRGQWVPWAQLNNDVPTLATLDALTWEEGSQEYKTLDLNQDFNIEQEPFDAWWIKTASDNELLAYCEGSAFADLADTRMTTYAAIFTSIAVLIKDANFTSNWLKTRLERLATQLSLPEMTEAVSMDIITKSSRIYPRLRLTPDQVFSYLTSLYAMIKESSAATSLNWIIEQAACSQITMALDFASGITRNNFINIDNLIDKVPRQQIIAYAQLCVEMVRDRFCSLITPPVKMADIADLAYLGGSLMGELEKRTGFQGLSSASAKCTLTKSELNALILEAKRLKEYADQEEASIASSFQKNPQVYGYSAEHTLVVEGDSVYIYPKASAPAITSEEDRELDDEGIARKARAIERSTWARKYKNLPVGAERISVVELQMRKSSTESDSARALKLLCSALLKVASQMQLQPIDPNNLNVLERHPAVPGDVIEAAQKLGFMPPKSYRQPEMRNAIKEVENLTIKSFTNNYRERLPTEPKTDLLLNLKEREEPGPSNVVSKEVAGPSNIIPPPRQVDQTQTDIITPIPYTIVNPPPKQVDFTQTEIIIPTPYTIVENLQALLSNSILNLGGSDQQELGKSFIGILAGMPEKPTVDVLLEHGILSPAKEYLASIKDQVLTSKLSVTELNAKLDGDWIDYKSDSITVLVLVCADACMSEDMLSSCLAADRAARVDH